MIRASFRRHRLMALVALSTLLSTTAVVSAAHDWTSPPVGPAAPRAAAWSGTLWAGPQSGAPLAPQAADCARPPQAIDLAGPELREAILYSRSRYIITWTRI